jgi:hypothetical protein
MYRDWESEERRVTAATRKCLRRFVTPMGYGPWPQCHNDDIIDAYRPEILRELRRLHRDNRMFPVGAAALGSN